MVIFIYLLGHLVFYLFGPVDSVYWTSSKKLISFCLDNSSRGLINSARVDVETSLVLCLCKFELQNLFYIMGQFLGPVS